jgi:hypothetical protein
MSHFIILTSSAKVNGARRRFSAEYRNVAILECRDGMYPKRIDVRDPAVWRIVHHYGAMHVGLTSKSAYHRTLVIAQRYCNSLNANREAKNGLRNEL